ncbi:MAG: superoxide dismutase family protein [Nocardioidaceae bacterium]
MHNVDGDRIGRVSMRQQGDSVRVLAKLHSLTPGFHGFHVHQTGLCEPAAAGGPFDTADGHYTGEHLKHGDHAGDMPSLLVNEDGKRGSPSSPTASALAELRDADGSAVMVHEGRDNFANIPKRYSKTGPDKATLRHR